MRKVSRTRRNQRSKRNDFSCKLKALPQSLTVLLEPMFRGRIHPTPKKRTLESNKTDFRFHGKNRNLLGFLESSLFSTRSELIEVLCPRPTDRSFLRYVAVHLVSRSYRPKLRKIIFSRLFAIFERNDRWRMPIFRTPRTYAWLFVRETMLVRGESTLPGTFRNFR